MIEVKNLKKIYTLGGNQVRALDGVSLSIAKGEFVAIMGPSGSGKSTLLQVLGLLDSPDEGSYKLEGHEVAGLKEDALAALRSKTLGFVFQQFNLLARTSALSNVRLPRLYTSEPEAPGSAEKLLDLVGLSGRLDHTPAQLSGGQQQRVAIARALMNGPRLIFADEPTGNLDSKSSVEILDLLQQLNRQGITIVMVTHEADIAARAGRRIQMKDGKVVSDRLQGRSKAASRTRTGLAAATGGGKSRSGLASLGVYALQAWRALMANKVRTGLSVLGILIGVAAVIAVMALGAGAQKTVKAQLSSLGSNLLVLYMGGSSKGGVNSGAGTSAKLHLEDGIAVAQKVPEVKRVSGDVNGHVQAVSNGKNWGTSVTGSSVDYPAMRNAPLALGRFFNDQEYRDRARVAVIGLTVAKNLFGDKNPVGLDMKLNRTSYRILGVFQPKGSSGWRDEDDQILVPATTAMYRLLGRDEVDSLVIEVKDETMMDAAQEHINAVMRLRFRVGEGKEDPFAIMNFADIQKAVTSSYKTIGLVLSVIAAISLLVGGIGIMNIMLVTVTERTREIGLRKALGAKRGDILFQFLVESAVVSSVGGMGGVAFGAAIIFTVSKLAGWAAEMSPFSVILAIGFSGFIGVLFGLWPAMKASKLRPIEALRYE